MLIVQNPVEIIELTGDLTVMADTATTATMLATVPLTVYDNHLTSSSSTTTTVQPSSSTSAQLDHQQLAPAPSTSSISPHQPAASSKRKSFCVPKTTSKQPKASDTHNQFSAMAKSKCVQIDEQMNMMKARENREKELNKLQIEKIELEVMMLKEREKRDSEAHMQWT